jgi:hypothetical protein
MCYHFIISMRGNWPRPQVRMKETAEGKDGNNAKEVCERIYMEDMEVAGRE